MRLNAEIQVRQSIQQESDQSVIDGTQDMTLTYHEPAYTTHANVLDYVYIPEGWQPDGQYGIASQVKSGTKFHQCAEVCAVRSTFGTGFTIGEDVSPSLDHLDETTYHFRVSDSQTKEFFEKGLKTY